MYSGPNNQVNMKMLQDHIDVVVEIDLQKEEEADLSLRNIKAGDMVEKRVLPLIEEPLQNTSNLRVIVYRNLNAPEILN